jgi:outer membrane murein-binding lipoprotein Lpp
MADQSERNTRNFVLASAGLGILAGVAAGLLIAARQSRRKPDPLAGTVEELRQRAERVLEELSSNVAQIAQQANAGLDEHRAEPVGSS